MAETSIQTKANEPSLAPPRPAVLKPAESEAWRMVKKILAPIASIRLTVVLLTLSILLVFFGTLAMIDQGLWTVVKNYFRCFYAWVPFQVFVEFGQVFFGLSPNLYIGGSFPFPGGWAIGAVMLVNLLAAHLVRFKLTWKRSGILILHSGLLLLFAGEIVTGTLAVEGRMQIRERQETNYVIDDRVFELAIVNSADPKDDEVVVVPQRMLKKGEVIRHEDLPFDIEVLEYMTNSALQWAQGEKQGVKAVEKAEVSGARSEADVPSVRVMLKDKKSGKVLEENYVASQHLIPIRSQEDGRNYAIVYAVGEKKPIPIPYEPVQVDGKEYEVSLRPKRTYKDYSIYLKDFRFDRYPGTQKAKNFSSEIRLKDHITEEERTVTIRMNEPMMHRGETFYQASFDDETEDATVLQVVKNPGKWGEWLSLDYLGCIVVSLGMLVHFGITLVGFLERRAAV